MKANDDIISGFVKNNQQLTTVVRRRSSEQLIEDKDLKKFEFELRNYHVIAAEKIATHFNSSLVCGLTTAIASSRLARNGPNEVKPPRDWPIWAKFIFTFFSGFQPLLWVATFFVFLSWEPFGTPPSNLYSLILAIVLLVVISVSSLFTFYQEQQASKILKGFANLLPTTCMVLRDGAYTSIEAADLVVGDVVQLQVGCTVPADMRVAQSNGMKVDKSMLTGEAEPMKAIADTVADTVSFLESPNVLFMGCNVVDGGGVGIVVATGADNQLAKIVVQTSGEAPMTSLQEEVNVLVFYVGGLALVTGMVVILFWAFNLRVYHPGFMTTSSMIANAISVIVAFVPEGLPLALSVGLTIIAKRLCSKYFVLVKRLGNIETLGSMSMLASDKTGTLTQNLMTVTGLLSSCDIEEEDEVSSKGPLDAYDATLIIAALCNQASFEHEDASGYTPDAAAPSYKPIEVSSADEHKYKAVMPVGGDLEGGKPVEHKKGTRVAVGSNSTDRAILSWVDSLVAVELVQRNHVVHCVLPFSSVTKYSAVVATNKATTETIVCVKGATENILPLCTRYMNAQGVPVPMTSDFSQRMRLLINTEASKGRRMITLAQTSPLDKLKYHSAFPYTVDPHPNFPISDLTFVSCLAVADPPREGVKEAVESLREAGIMVAMVTGDAAPTAIAIARQVGIVTTASKVDTLADSLMGVALLSGQSTSEAIAITGKELETITPQQWDYIFLHNEMVFARTTPEQKLMIVAECQARGHRVGVTGDGVNDCPALKKADVGIAMNSGADIAREVAAIVLLKDDFTAIVHGVREGRCIFENLRKVVGYQISCGCWAELLPVLATFFLGMAQPLSSFLMIMISCISDVFAGIALMSEPPEGAIMSKPPRDTKKTRLLDWKLICYSYLFIANIASLGAFINYFLYMANRGNTRAVPTPVPADDDGQRVFPAGYRANQLIYAWNWGLDSGNLGDDETSAAAVGSSVFYVTLVLGQMAHLLSIRQKTPYFFDSIYGAGKYQRVSGKDENRDSIAYQSLPVRLWDEITNSSIQWPIVYAWIGALCTVQFFNYIPVFQKYCGTGVVPGTNWGIAIGFAVAWFTLAEIRKWIVKVYPESWIGQTAW